jgi:hypothetical protein
MRLLILATASILVLTGTVMADSVPADTLNAHDSYMRNLRDSGYNPAGDRHANGNVIMANMYSLKRVWRPKQTMNTP